MPIRNEEAPIGIGLAKYRSQWGAASQNVTVYPIGCAMLDMDRSEEILDGEFVEADEPASVELVPVTQTVSWSSKKPVTSPDPRFLAHLIATADHVPQTRGLRRASPADAQSAYGAGQARRYGVGFRTRHTA